MTYPLKIKQKRQATVVGLSALLFLAVTSLSYMLIPSSPFLAVSGGDDDNDKNIQTMFESSLSVLYISIMTGLAASIGFLVLSRSSIDIDNTYFLNK